MIGKWNRGSSWEGRCWVFLLWSCSTVGIFCCHLTLVVWALRLYYCWDFSQSHLNYGLSAIDCRCYFHQATSIDSIEVKYQDCNNQGSGPAVGVMGATLTLSWPNPHVYVPTQSTNAKAYSYLHLGCKSIHCPFRSSVGNEFTRPVTGVSVHYLGNWEVISAFLP